MTPNQKVHVTGMSLFGCLRAGGPTTMRTLLIVAFLFFFVFGGVIAYFAVLGDEHEYDLKLVLPIDTRQMPKSTAAPEIVSQEAEVPGAVTDGRADSGPPPQAPDRPLVQFGNRAGAASEAAGQ
jgi:hypothetical protein